MFVEVIDFGSIMRFTKICGSTSTCESALAISFKSLVSITVPLGLVTVLRRTTLSPLGTDSSSQTTRLWNFFAQ